MADTKPPATATTHVLPFRALSAEDFERLCLWLIEREGFQRVEHLGASGGEQGRDIVAWRGDRRWAFQCKQVQRFGPSDALAEVDKILALPDAERPAELVFLVTCNISDKARKAVRKRCGQDIECHFWGRTELDERVNRHSDIVEHFFGVPSEGAGRRQVDLSPRQRARLESQYLKGVVEECQWLHTEGVEEDPVPLTDVFVLLQAVPSRERLPAQRHADVAPLGERLEHAGLPIGQDEVHPELLDKVLRENQHLVLIGEPGAGKTTTVRYIALALADPGRVQSPLGLPGHQTPVLVSLAQQAPWLASGRLNEVLGSVVARAADVDEPTAHALLAYWRGQGRLVILLDGLDEVQDGRDAVAQEIGRFGALQQRSGCRVIVTSRMAGRWAFREPFKEYQVCPFQDAEDAVPYVAKWLVALQGTPRDAALEKAGEFMEQMVTHAGMRRITDNPLLLRMAVSIYVLTGDLVPNRARLYEDYFGQVLWKRACRRNPCPLPRVDAMKALAVVAWALQVQGLRTIKALEARLWETSMSGPVDAGELLDWFRHPFGILIRYPAPESQEWCLAFSHRTFQEYFVSQLLKQAWEERCGDAWCFLRPRLHQEVWREPILLMAGALPDATLLVRSILRARSPYEQALRRDLLLAARIVGEGAEVGQRQVAGIVRIAASAISRVRRALRWGVAVDTFLLGAVFVVHLSAGWKWVGLGAWSLVWLGVVLGRFPLLQQFLLWPTRLVGTGGGSAAYDALEEIGDERAVDALLKALRNDFSSGGARWDADDALGKIGGERAVEGLLQALHDAPSNVRRRATVVLGEIGGERAVGGLLQALQDADFGVRERAAGTLGEIGDTCAIDGLLQALHDDHSYVRRWAANALGEIGDARVVDALLQALHDTDHYVRESAAGALGKIGGERAVDTLLQALHDVDTDVCRRAAKALGEIGGDRAVNALLQALCDANHHVRKSAAGALGEIGDARSVDALLQALYAADLGVRGSAAGALGKVGGERAVDALLLALHDVDFSVRDSAAVALGEIGDARAVDGLLRVLHDTESGVRRRATRALGKIGNARAVNGLLQALYDADFGVREGAADALGKIGDACVIDGLLQALSDARSSSVRCRAARALGEIGNARAVDALLQALHGAQSDVRARAADALGKIGGDHAVEGLLQALHDADPYVRERAAFALENTGVSCSKEYVRRVARALGWRLTDIKLESVWPLCIRNGVAEAARAALGQTAARLAEPGQGLLSLDPFAPAPPAPKFQWLRLGLIALVSSLAALLVNVLTDLLGASYPWPAKLALGLVVFALTWIGLWLQSSRGSDGQ